MKNEEYVFNFEKLRVWQESRKLTTGMYKMITTFPDYEKYALCSQMRRALVSVCSNIAEGASRISRKEFLHFCHISYGSLMEVLNQLYIALDLGYINKNELDAQKKNISYIANQLNALNRSLST